MVKGRGRERGKMGSHALRKLATCIVIALALRLSAHVSRLGVVMPPPSLLLSLFPSLFFPVCTSLCWPKVSCFAPPVGYVPANCPGCLGATFTESQRADLLGAFTKLFGISAMLFHTLQRTIYRAHTTSLYSSFHLFPA